MDLLILQEEMLLLRKRIEWIVALLRLTVVLLKVTGASLNNTRVSDASKPGNDLRS